MDAGVHIFERAAQLQAEGKRFALLTVIRTGGSTPRKAGAKMIVQAEGQTHGTIGGGRIEHELVAEARSALDEDAPRIVRRHLTHELAMCCGGEMEVFIDVSATRETLVLVGAGHIGAALAPIGSRVGFSVVVVDEMEEFASRERFAGASALVHDWDPVEWPVRLDGSSYVVVATRDHAIDQKVLERCAAADARPAYLGVVGSRGKMGRFRKRLEAKGISADWIEQVRGPIGVDIGAETPEEIALSIATELVGVRRSRRGHR